MVVVVVSGGTEGAAVVDCRSKPQGRATRRAGRGCVAVYGSEHSHIIRHEASGPARPAHKKQRLRGRHCVWRVCVCVCTGALPPRCMRESTLQVYAVLCQWHCWPVPVLACCTDVRAYGLTCGSSALNATSREATLSASAVAMKLTTALQGRRGQAAGRRRQQARPARWGVHGAISRRSGALHAQPPPPPLPRLHACAHSRSRTHARTHLSASCLRRPYVPKRCSRCTSVSLNGLLPLLLVDAPPPAAAPVAGLPASCRCCPSSPTPPPCPSVPEPEAEAAVEVAAASCRTSQGCCRASGAVGRAEGSRCGAGRRGGGGGRGQVHGGTRGKATRGSVHTCVRGSMGWSVSGVGRWVDKDAGCRA